MAYPGPANEPLLQQVAVTHELAPPPPPQRTSTQQARRCMCRAFATAAITSTVLFGVYWFVLRNRGPPSYPPAPAECPGVQHWDCPYARSAGHAPQVAGAHDAQASSAAVPPAPAATALFPGIHAAVDLCWAATHDTSGARGTSNSSATYEVEATDMFTGAWNTVYTGHATSASNLTFPTVRIVPASSMHLRVRVTPAGATHPGPWSANATLQVAPCGYCTNSSDLSVLRAEWSDMQSKGETCGKSCILSGKGEKCDIHCLMRETGMSYNCSECWAGTQVCTRDHCFTDCVFSPESQTCWDCRVSSCGDAFSSCSGLPLWMLDVARNKP